MVLKRSFIPFVDSKFSDRHEFALFWLSQSKHQEMASKTKTDDETIWIARQIHPGIDLRNVKLIDQYDKDLVYGYLKAAQLLLSFEENSYYIILKEIQNICLLFLAFIEFQHKYDISRR